MHKNKQTQLSHWSYYWHGSAAGQSLHLLMSSHI